MATIKADGGYFLLGSIEGGVWDDHDANGLRDEGESHLGNIPVTLYDGNDNSLGTIKTDDRGRYEFDDIEPGDYRVEFLLGDGVEFTRRLTSTLNSQTSAVSQASGSTSTLTVVSDRDLQVWAGVVGHSFQTGIGGLAWSDENGNGIHDPHETGLPGIRVQAYSSDEYALVATTNTDQDGRYSFPDLIAANYTSSL